jgi:hypothetical protein
MRRAWIAAALLAASSLALAACGSSSSELEPGLKAALRDLAKAVVVNDKPTIQSFIQVGAGCVGNPMDAADATTPEGRERLYEANRRWIRQTFRDAGIAEEKDIETFMGAIKFNIDGKNAWVNFEIAGVGRRTAEVVTFRLQHGEKGWTMFEYSRLMKGMR